MPDEKANKSEKNGEKETKAVEEKEANSDNDNSESKQTLTEDFQDLRNEGKIENFKNPTQDIKQALKEYKGGEVSEISDEEKQAIWKKIIKNACYPTAILDEPEVRAATKQAITFKNQYSESNYRFDYNPSSLWETRYYLSQNERNIASGVGLSAKITVPKELAEIGKVSLKAAFEKEEKKFNQETRCYFLSTYTSPKVLVRIEEDDLYLTQKFINALKEVVAKPKREAKQALTDLFDEYGCIVPLELYIGGRITYRSEKTVETHGKASKTISEITAALETMSGGIEAGVKTHESETLKNLKGFENEKTYFSGGDQDQTNMGLWKRTLNPKSSKVIGFGRCKTVLDFLARQDSDLYKKVIDICTTQEFLIYRYQQPAIRICNDSGSGAERDLTIFAPDKIEQDWKILGFHAVARNIDQCDTSLILVKDPTGELLKPPVAWETTEFSRLISFGTEGVLVCFKAKPPDGYVSIGDIVLWRRWRDTFLPWQSGSYQPEENLKEKYRCVRADLTIEAEEEVSWENYIWKHVQKTIFGQVTSSAAIYTHFQAKNEKDCLNAGTFYVQIPEDQKPDKSKLRVLNKKYLKMES